MKIAGFKDTIDWYNLNANQYSKAIENIVLDHNIDKFISLIPPNSLVLDAGCSAGKDMNVLTQKGLHTVGVDLSSGLLKVGKEKYPSMSLIQANFLKLPFANNLFNGIWANSSLVHLETIEDVENTLTEFNRVLKDRGVLYTYVKAQTGSNETEVIKDKLSNHDRFFRYYTEDKVKTFLEASKFKIIDIGKEPDLSRRPGVEWIVAFARKV